MIIFRGGFRGGFRGRRTRRGLRAVAATLPDEDLHAPAAGMEAKRDETPNNPSTRLPSEARQDRDHTSSGLIRTVLL